MQYYSFHLGALPLVINCFETGQISISRGIAKMPLIIDQPEVGVQAIISQEDIAIGADTVIQYDYLYAYRQMPELLSWLQAQKMELPLGFK